MPRHTEKSIVRDAKQHLVGKKVVDVVYLSREQADCFGYRFRAPVLVLEGGTTLLPLADEEGNDVGALIGSVDDGGDILLPRLP